MRSHPLPLMSKGEEEQIANRKSKQQEKEKANRESGLPSMPKGETVGNIVIDGKGGSTQAKEAALRQKRQCCSKGRQKRHSESNRGSKKKVKM